MMTGIASSSTAVRVIAAPIPFAPPLMTMTLSLSCKSIESGSVQSKDVRFLSWGETARVILDESLHLLVARGTQADWPVRAEHQTIRPKLLESNIQVRTKSIIAPAFPVGFCYQT